MSHLSPLNYIYLDYIAAINARDWTTIADRFTRPTVIHNNVSYTGSEYAAMIERSIEPYGDIKFIPYVLIVNGDQGTIGCRIRFESPTVPDPFYEHVFYQFVEGKIHEVWSMVELPKT